MLPTPPEQCLAAAPASTYQLMRLISQLAAAVWAPKELFVLAPAGAVPLCAHSPQLQPRLTVSE